MPERPRINYNLGILYDHLRKEPQAEAALRRAVELEPDNMDYLRALAQHYLKRGNMAAAGRIADQMIARHPEERTGLELKEFIRSQMKGAK
jgi:Tfp pilus assembly protein PilF